MMGELEQRSRRVIEATNVPVDIRHVKSVIQGIIDTETLKHVSK